jgi:hypothetical protein
MQLQRLRMILPFVLILLFCGKTLSQIEKDESERWINKNWKSLLEKTLPIEPIDIDNYRKPDRWLVSIRICDPDISVMVMTVRQYYSGTVELNAIRPLGASIIEQVEKAIRPGLNTSISEVAKKIKLARSSISSEKCPVLVELAKEYEKISISAVFPDRLLMDSTEYKVVAQNVYGDYIQMLYKGPGLSAREQEEPIIDWIKKLRKVSDLNCK